MKARFSIYYVKIIKNVRLILRKYLTFLSFAFIVVDERNFKRKKYAPVFCSFNRTVTACKIICSHAPVWESNTAYRW